MSSSGISVQTAWRTRLGRGVLYLGMLLYPGALLVLEYTGGAIYLMLFLAGLVFALKKGDGGEFLGGRDKVFMFVLLLLFVVGQCSALASGSEFIPANRFFVIAAAAAVYMLFRRMDFDERWFWAGLCIGLITAFGVSVYQVFGPPGQARATGIVHPIIFGDLSMAMALIVFGMLTVFGHHRLLLFLTVLLFMMGMLGSFLSLSRGGWAALPLAVLILWWFYRGSFAVRLQLLGIALFAVFLGLAVVLYPGLNKRIASTVNNVQAYMGSAEVTDRSRATSIGSRFEMWKSAWSMFRESPWVGGGWDRFQQHSREMIRQKKLHPAVSRYTHPHNEYLSVLAKGGVFSFMALMALFMVPAWIFYRVIQEHPGEKQAGYALSGLLLIGSFMAFGLSEAIFERMRPVLFFSFYLAVFMAGALKPWSLRASNTGAACET